MENENVFSKSIQNHHKCCLIHEKWYVHKIKNLFSAQFLRFPFVFQTHVHQLLVLIRWRPFMLNCSACSLMSCFSPFHYLSLIMNFLLKTSSGNLRPCPKQFTLSPLQFHICYTISAIDVRNHPMPCSRIYIHFSIKSWGTQIFWW